MKEILLYNEIYSYSAASFIREMEDNKGNDICVRGNCPGGSMFNTFGMVAKFKEHSKGKQIQVDGIAASAFAYMLCFADKVKCLDASTFLYHRAIMGSQEDEKNMPPEERKMLDTVNGQIRAALESKASAQHFKDVTGYSYDEMFSMDSRIDVVLTPTQMKQLGIVHEITALTAGYKADITALAKSHNVVAFSTDPVINDPQNKVMNAAEFKAANPTAYAEILAEGAKSEKIRVKTWLAYEKIDPAAVAAGIKSDEACGPDAQAEFMVKAMSGKMLDNAKADNAPNVVVDPAATTTKEPTAEEKNTAVFLAACKVDLNIK